MLTDEEKLVLSKLGRMGGLATKSGQDEDYYRRIGKIGGDFTLEAHGPGHFKQMARRSAEVRRERARLRRAIRRGVARLASGQMDSDGLGDR